MGKYTVTWAYPDGNPHSQEFNEFADAVHFSRAKGALGIGAFITGDGCEHDGEEWHDGLTDEERDQL